MGFLRNLLNLPFGIVPVCLSTVPKAGPRYPCDLATSNPYSTPLTFPPLPLTSSIVARLLENMIPMPPDAVSLEHIRESQAARDLVFRNDVVSIFRLANDEFTNLLAH
jgi:hypothetical protein